MRQLKLVLLGVLIVTSTPIMADNATTEKDILVGFGVFSKAAALAARCKYSFVSDRDLSVLDMVKVYLRSGLVEHYGMNASQVDKVGAEIARSSKNEMCHGQNEISTLNLIKTIRNRYKSIY